LSAFPLAGPGPDPVAPGSPLDRSGSDPFLDAWEHTGLRIALPPSFAQLQGGVTAVNRILRGARGSTVGVPDLADRPVVVHAGIVHPGETIPKTVPDARTLRQRVLMHAPYAAVTAAILLLHRLSPARVEIVDDGAGWVVRGGGDDVPLLDWIDAFAVGRGWLPIRRSGAGLGVRPFVATLEALGVATAVGRVLVLAESLFTRLQTEAEESEIHARLQPLADAVDAAIGASA
ncbi:MAG: hypothetical protein ABMB14_23155, partial [Myxococcota bacterium]